MRHGAMQGHLLPKASFDKEGLDGGMHDVTTLLAVLHGPPDLRTRMSSAQRCPHA